MIRKLILIFSLVVFAKGFSQYHFKGQLSEDVKGKTVYLSIIEDYRKLSRVYPEQIFKKVQADTLGNFVFDGDNISNKNGIYRIHIDECSDGLNNTDHYFNKCKYSKSVLFIANNRDTLIFERTFANEMFCDLKTTKKNGFRTCNNSAAILMNL